MKARVVAVLLLLFLATVSVGARASHLADPPSRSNSRSAEPPLNTLIIGWDGVQRDHFFQCYNKDLPECSDGLPNIKWLSGDHIFDLTVTDGATVTKPGWAQILSGYDADVMGIQNNDEYRPLPEGYTVLEKLEAYYGDDVFDTVFVSGKGYHVGATCQGELNVGGRTEPLGQPWCLTKRQIDTFVEAEDYELPNEVVGGRALDLVIEHFDEHPDQSLVALFHFSEPDATGHDYDENSVEYSEKLIDLDEWLGRIIAELQSLGAYDDTLIYVVTDHGFDEAHSTHYNAPYGVFATNDPLVIRSGDRKDFAPTLLERYDVEAGPPGVIPPVDGQSLYSLPEEPCVPVGSARLDYPGAPECCADLALVGLDKHYDGPTAMDRCVAPTGGTGDGSGYCSLCGDGQCAGTEAENVCNCPEDCEADARSFAFVSGPLSSGERSRSYEQAAATCPPGQVRTRLLAEDFESWPPVGWSIVNNGGSCDIESSSVLERPNNTGGDGACADADADRCGPGATMQAELWSPVLDLSGYANAYLRYRTHYLNFMAEDEAYLDISTDGGGSWANLLTWAEEHYGPGTQDIDLTPHTGSAETILRWRYHAPGWDWYWEIDDVSIDACIPAPPGAHLVPAAQETTGCAGESVAAGLSLWNNTGSAGSFSLGYDAPWPADGPSELEAGLREVVPFTTTVQVQCTDVATVTITATGNNYTDTAVIQVSRGERWEVTPPLPTARGDLAVLDAEGDLYAVGGTADGAGAGQGENERFEPVSGGWNTMAPMSVPLSLIDGGAIDGVIYIPGGYDGRVFTTTVLAYDAALDQWFDRAPAPRAVAAYGVTACGGLLYRIGGAYRGQWYRGDAGVEVYDPLKDSWSILPPMVHGHAWPAVGCIGGKLYVAGGYNEEWEPTAEAGVYDLALEYWDDTAMADLPHAWSMAAHFVREGRLYLAGGHFGGHAVVATISYDPATDAWTYGPPLHDARYRLAATSLEGTAYVFGGFDPGWSPHGSSGALPLGPLCVRVGGIGLKSFAVGPGHAVLAGILILDENDRPVPGLSVGSHWTLPNGAGREQRAETRPQGVAWYGLLSGQTGMYEICVTDVTGEGYFCAAAQNLETCDTLDVP